jgi:hypothetical protein
MLEPQSPGTLRAIFRPVMGLLYLFIIYRHKREIILK